ncbi:ATP-dependent DNA helicase RecG [Candidatus Omnitrophota bacterium]
MKKIKRELETPVRYLKGVGPKRAEIFAKQGILTIEDLYYYFPRRYEDRRNLSQISSLKPGTTETIKADVTSCDQRRSFRRRGFSIVEVTVEDPSGKLACVWFNQPYLKDYLKEGVTLILFGRVEEYAGRLQMNSPEFELIDSNDDQPLNTGRIVPVYPLPKGLTQRVMRKMVKKALDEDLSSVHDFLPYTIRSRNHLFNLAKSLINIHFPGDEALRKEAYRRLSFQEFLLFQIPLALRKLKRSKQPGIAHKSEGSLADDFIKALPFKLTAAQEKVIAEIKKDMAGSSNMQRLLQGDVGSGKTIVATIAAVIGVQSGYQAAFMVPTEVLAGQHFEKISRQLKASGARGVRVAQLSAGVKAKSKVRQDLAWGRVDLVIGTHALLEEGVSFKKLGLVIIDEQHKFGVGQRALLPKKGNNPDVLIMTATPIPRTLAITIYGDLDISVINELPKGRHPIKTEHLALEERLRAYESARRHLELGAQVYVIYPVIEESFALDMEGAKQTFKRLAGGELKEYKVGLIHGRMSQEEQQAVMQKFRAKELQVLVSTTVLEVGIDCPDASCIIIERAERFGLSQLHQLRGRVGRGSRESECILLSDALSAEAESRIRVMVEHRDGFHIAEEDLKIRGPGEFFGRRQHGLSGLRVANPLTQMQLLKKARADAIRLITVDPGLKERQNISLREKLLQRFPEYEELILVG